MRVIRRSKVRPIRPPSIMLAIPPFPIGKSPPRDRANPEIDTGVNLRPLLVGELGHG
jgi:hypothetical protein